MHVLTTPTHRRLSALFAAAAAAALPLVPAASHAAAPTSAPQVLLAITNSESMDGTTAGAIMVGSGNLGSSYSTLNSSSSPLSYTPDTGFSPPGGTNADGTANYTVTCQTLLLCDNSQSRLNMTKAAIKTVTAAYGSTLNFGVYTYSTSGTSLYTTWVYYMSPSGGFTFTNTASPTGGTVANPCYNYSSASSSVKSACGSIAGTNLYGSTLGTYQYMTIGATSDNAQINDVLYWSNSSAAFVTYGTVSPSNPYTYYSLSTYNTNLGSYSESYSKNSNSGGWSTTPTNAGYVPFSPQVIYAMRGFGYGASQSATTGSAKVAMGTDPSSSTFTNALLPETNSSSSSEIKSVAGQSGIYALMHGAKSYLGGLTHGTCQGQYVVLLTDGLPTLDSSGNAWPPLGTTTANAYSLTASYDASGNFVSSNSQAVSDAITAIQQLYSAGVKVYVIGLGAGVDKNVNPSASSLLTAMAKAGGTTDYFAANNPTSLTNAFQAIVAQIYSDYSIAAPVAPISVAGGSSYEYVLTSIPSPASGHASAYATAGDGTRANTASWDASDPAKNTTALRGQHLMSTNASNSVVTLANVETAAWSLTASTCLPDTTTEIGYIVNPGGTCFGTGRDASFMLAPFSTQNTGRYVSAPSAALLVQKYSTYATYARANSGRTPMLMFTNEDGFLYSVNASTGSLLWGWTSRNLLPKFQNYSTLLTTGWTDGSFTVADAMDASGNWGSYVVGSLQSGGQHYSLKLDSSGNPSSVVFDSVVTNGSAPGDKAPTAIGASPLRSPTVVAYIGNNAYEVYVVTVGTVSTLYETNVATGASSSAPLTFTLSSALALNPATNQLYYGGTNGSVWVMALMTGTANTDVAQALQVGTMVNPATGGAVAPLYIGYTELGPTPYIYALGTAQLTVFGVAQTGWRAMWATTPSQGYTYNGTSWATSSTVTTLTAGSVVSDIPMVIGNSLLVPVYVAGSGCSSGTGWYDFFNIASGIFPTDLTLTVNGAAVTSDINIGSGQALTPSVTLVSGGVALNDCSAGSTPCSGEQQLPSSSKGKAITWRQH